MVSWKLGKNAFRRVSMIQDVPYNMYPNATAVLNIDSAYKQIKNYQPQLHNEECNTPVQIVISVGCWVIQIMMDILRCKWRDEQVHRNKDFCDPAEAYKTKWAHGQSCYKKQKS